MEALLLPSLIVFLASLLQACTGFGFSIMATPFLLFFFPAQTAIQLNIILSIAISLYMLPGVRHEVDRSLLRRLIIGSIPGGLAGIFIFLHLETGMLKLAVGSIIIALTALLMLRLSMRQTGTRDHAAGTLSGLFTTSLGMPGIPLLLYFAGTRMDKATLRSTTLSYFLFIYTVALVMQFLVGSTSQTIWLTSATLLPALLIGMVAGKLLFKHIDQENFRRLTLLILVVTGLYLLLGPR